jgi:hypothetical protein
MQRAPLAICRYDFLNFFDTSHQQSKES